MIVAFTGHRPEKIGGYNLPNPKYISICKKIEAALKELQPERAISGMCIGVDQWSANICIKLNIPFTAAIPFVGQENVWPDQSKKVYKAILAKAHDQVIVSEGGYSAHKLQLRNEWMVDQLVNSDDVLIVVWDGLPGGTGNCVAYAEKVNKKIYRIEP